jgi:molybdopterin synthase catalytic subunit
VEEAVVTVCMAVSRAEIVEKFNTITERVKERKGI